MINYEDCVIILVYGLTGSLYFDVFLFLRLRIEFSFNLPIYLFTDFPGAVFLCSDEKAPHRSPLCRLHRDAHPL